MGNLDENLKSRLLNYMGQSSLGGLLSSHRSGGRRGGCITSKKSGRLEKEKGSPVPSLLNADILMLFASIPSNEKNGKRKTPAWTQRSIQPALDEWMTAAYASLHNSLSICHTMCTVFVFLALLIPCVFLYSSVGRERQKEYGMDRHTEELT